MSVMTTGGRGGLARVTALPRPRTDGEERGMAGGSRPGGRPGEEWAWPGRAGQAGDPGQARPAGQPEPAGETRYLAGRPRVAVFRQVTGHRQVREFRQVAEVRVAREVHVVRTAAAAGARMAPAGQVSPASRAPTGTASRVLTGTASRPARRPAGPGRAHLTRRGRMVVTALLVLASLVVMALVWLTATARAQATGSGPPPGSVYRNLTSVVVHPGQSLWSIASRAQPSADPRIVMQEIIDLNALHGTSLVPGQRLWVPRA